jgi:regulator of protease activity HflC (stomatin/prohibitin superfamily)
MAEQARGEGNALELRAQGQAASVRLAGDAEAAAVRAVGAAAGRKRSPRRLSRRERPANVVASRSFLVDVHLLGR